MRAQASSLPPSPLTTQPGADIADKSLLPNLTPIGSQYSTPIERPITDNIWSYSEVVRTGTRDPSPAPKGAATTIPGLRLESYLARVSWLEGCLVDESFEKGLRLQDELE
ncbi:hypothetical protein M404DRAFT_26383 [Pisolithus tinctorius Marx 270]|uniref:Uncharacterized protein n=1 Tax=Pisolithus tinctorius Marx 270 TaxID=870435 RepID=A0A0C3P9F7_PISTI|nr:hypothetical protein M404DRAFT_26383 [Pisolithus tinctorius Marx 270]